MIFFKVRENDTQKMTSWTRKTIKYELSSQSTTRLKYIDKFDQLLIIHQSTSTVDNSVRSLKHLTIFLGHSVHRVMAFMHSHGQYLLLVEVLLQI
jgi:hypothetical protein